MVVLVAVAVFDVMVQFFEAKMLVCGANCGCGIVKRFIVVVVVLVQ